MDGVIEVREMKQGLTPLYSVTEIQTPGFNVTLKLGPYGTLELTPEQALQQLEDVLPVWAHGLGEPSASYVHREMQASLLLAGFESMAPLHLSSSGWMPTVQQTLSSMHFERRSDSVMILHLPAQPGDAE